MTGAVKPHVLVVDDDQSVRLMMKTVLEDAGYSVLEAQDGLEAMPLLQSGLHRMVILLDWMMPQMSGEEVLQAVKDGPPALQRHAYILVTANTPTRSTRLLELLTTLGVPVIPKPFRLQQLLDIVDEHVRQLDSLHAVG
jgi:CheY-like chemotaxis protein